MKSQRNSLSLLLVVVILSSLLAGQQTAQPQAIVPRLVNYSGKAIDAKGNVVSGTAGVTFAIYKDQSQGAPLWIETQNVASDAKGNFTAQLGATKSEGLPLDLFASGEARWLGVRVNGGEEQPRVLLLSVPYALKAEDATTLGGLPASAFMLAAPASGGGMAAATATAGTTSAVPPPNNAVTGLGTVNAIPLWDTTSDIVNSAITQTGTGAAAKIGIGTTAPASTLDVKGAGTVRGMLSLPATGAANAAAGKNSQPINLAASAFNSGTGTAVNQNFRWQAEPVGNDTSTTSGSLNLLYGSGSNPPAETGLKVASNGLISFGAGQTFPGTGSVTSVGLTAPSTDFTVAGSPVTKSGTLALNWTVAPTSAATASAIVKRDASGNFSAATIQAAAILAGASNAGTGVTGTTSTGIGVFGNAGAGYGVVGESSSSYGVYGQSNTFPGVGGVSSSSYGVDAFSENSIGIYAHSENNRGVYGESFAQTDGVFGYAHHDFGNGVSGLNDGGNGSGVSAVNTSTGDGLYSYSHATGADAGFFDGNVDVDGNLSKAAGSFKIDHPLDPANKYLYHSFVESPDMMNIYNGVVDLDDNGAATVQLPDWFESLNRDFRYQLTAVGKPGPNLYIAAKVQAHTFKIAGGQPGMEVSWQVTGIRHDAWADAHRIPLEQMKDDKDRGLYLHPELFGAPADKSIAMAHHPAMQRLVKEMAAKRAASAKH